MINFPFKPQIKKFLASLGFNRYGHGFYLFDGRIRVYLTLKCNLNCSYCPNYFCPSEFKSFDYQLKGADEWVSSLNRIGRDIVFTGGEPTLHPEFYEIVNGIDPSLGIQIYTNFCFDSKEFIKRIERPVDVYGSYHPCAGKPEKIIKVIKTLRNANISLSATHGVGERRQLDFLIKAADEFEQNNIDFYINQDMFEKNKTLLKGKTKKMSCTRKIILIAPDGTRYMCVSQMVRNVHPRENILKSKLIEDRISILCHEYGNCSPCDWEAETSFKPYYYYLLRNIFVSRKTENGSCRCYK